ncbi:MAG: BBOF1/CCDC121 family protein [Clostridium sp.]|jgi:hypothetical protein|nr:BBOF1/CCDC121 family protein [Clostridium sp.]
MIDWEDFIRTESVEDLREVKLWLFRENMRLEKEKKELDGLQRQFVKERKEFQEELKTISRRTALEQKRLKDENLFFDKKMAILQDGFRMLDEDRKKLEQERTRWEQERGLLEDRGGRYGGGTAQVLFRSVTNPGALKKRYHDLVKIFHPDNPCGDEELVQLINREFSHRQKNQERNR